jgi:hypothetical protein
MTETQHPLTGLGGRTPLDVGLGHMLLNIADPLPGHERAYTRWYEDDHFFSAAMMAPFVFAGRRWVATSDLRALQQTHAGVDGDDAPAGGSHAATYWIAPGHLGDYLAWSAGTGPALEAQGRNFTDRQLVFVTFADHIDSVYRDEEVPRDVYTLMDPPGGMVVQLIDVPDASRRNSTAQWLTREFLPERLALQGSSARSVLLFHGASDTASMRPALQGLQRQADRAGRRILLLWFLDDDPRAAWESEFASLPDLVREQGHGTITWTAPFVPAQMGTDTYVDHLGLH